MEKNNVLDYDSLIELDNERYSTKEVVVSINEKEFHINVAKRFRDSQMASLLSDVEQMYRDSKDLDLNLENMFIIVSLLLKHFTDISVPDDLMKRIQFVKILADNSVLNPILEAFDPSEIQRITVAMEEATNKMAETIKLIEDQRKLIEQLEQRELEKLPDPPEEIDPIEEDE